MEEEEMLSLKRQRELIRPLMFVSLPHSFFTSPRDTDFTSSGLLDCGRQ